MAQEILGNGSNYPQFPNSLARSTCEQKFDPENLLREIRLALLAFATFLNISFHQERCQASLGASVKDPTFQQDIPGNKS